MQLSVRRICAESLAKSGADWLVSYLAVMNGVIWQKRGEVSRCSWRLGSDQEDSLMDKDTGTILTMPLCSWRLLAVFCSIMLSAVIPSSV